jgi:iron complex transport system substrate-binding protein
MNKLDCQGVFSCLQVYGLVIALIASWWCFAFRQNDDAVKNLLEDILTDATTDQTPPHSSLLSPINRDLLRKALSGDTSLMIKLMSDWDVDAQIMQADGSKYAKRLPRNDLLRAQILERQLKSRVSDQIQEASTVKCINDATGRPISLKNTYSHFLPQTYAAASFLLALARPEEIVALPRRLREQEQLYPKAITDQIPLDCDRYHSEKLFLANPQVAFIAHYSHPATIQALHNQGVQLYMMRDLNTLSDICEELLSIGGVVNHSSEAELLKIFIEAAMLAIDNRVAGLNLNLASREQPPRVLFLNYYQSYSIPTRRTLTGQLLHRIGLLDASAEAFSRDNSNEWMIPIDKESILNLNPDYLIISTENGEGLKREIYRDPALNQLTAVRNNRLFFVDEAIQHSPSQYIVLAYHDLIQALAKLP